MGNGQGKPVDLNGEVNLNDFRLLRVVGRGAFGKVRIVERKDTNLSFALKYIRKDKGELLFMYRHDLCGMFHLLPHLATDLVASHL
ncbi:hypothetical protein BKA56DRAFT_682191 [Ilyonectria sp. MPI-CAGE-AT-0026]|nr:hypothetical protein BKA56DRAFT_682191 [Ilyonectria sp. MPI-CAGE-AT-0026]